MPPIENPLRPVIAGPEGFESTVQKSAIALPQLRAKLFSHPISSSLLCVLLWVALLGIFRVTTRNEYEKRPIGDAAYFCEMTQSFYLGEPPAINFPTMHSRRILGPWLAARLCSLLDLINGKRATTAFHYGYYAEDYFHNWSPEAAFTYDRIMTSWKVLNSAALLGIFLSLFGILRHFQPNSAPPWQPSWLAFILCCAPTLGRLYFICPLMNDLAGISLGLLSLFCLLKNRVLLSGLLFGAAMLARENLALIYPCFVWALFTLAKGCQGRKLLKLSSIHALLSFSPYCWICALPVFPDVAPFSDWSSGIQQAAAGATQDYWSLVVYHLRRSFLGDQALLRNCLVYWSVLGPLLFLALRFYPWKKTELQMDAFLWVAFLLIIAASFHVDRYVVYAVFPLTLLARHALNRGIRWWVAGLLSCFYLAAVQFFNERVNAKTLQIEFAEKAVLISACFWGACALVIVLLDPFFFFFFNYIPQKTTVREEGALSF